MKQSLGMIEVKGFAEAVKVSDVMSKVANIRLISTKMTKGGGWMSIFIEGDVGAVNAAIQSGTAEAKANGTLVSSKVIPRPLNGLEVMFIDEEKIELSVAETIEAEQHSSDTKEVEPTEVQNIAEAVGENTTKMTDEILKKEIKQPDLVDIKSFDEKKQKLSKARTKKSKK